MIPRTPISTLFPYTTLFRSPSHPEKTSERSWPLRPRTFASSSPIDLGCVQRRSEWKFASGKIAGALRCRASLSNKAHASSIDRKSTRLNSSHTVISYAVFCLNDSAYSDLYTLSLHDALPISLPSRENL